jgi:hypothetical protein
MLDPASVGVVVISTAAIASAANPTRFVLLAVTISKPPELRSFRSIRRGSWVQDEGLKIRRNGCNRKHEGVIQGPADNQAKPLSRRYDRVIERGLSVLSGPGITNRKAGGMVCGGDFFSK